MPEGDTIFRAARALDRILTGRRVVRFELRSGPGIAARRGARPAVGGARPGAALPPPAARPPQPGELITSVRAQGKHLLIAFEGGTTLHTHMQMTGSWHAYRPGEPWKKKPAAARVVLEVADAPEPDVVVAVAVCFAAPVVELVEEPTAHPRLAALGPDLCRPDADLDEALARLDRLPADTEVGVALLDQRVACGVGNIYKSETLYACRLDPFTPLGALDVVTRRSLFETAARLLQANLDTAGARATLGPGAGAGPGPSRGGLGVYGRTGRPCRRCGTPIRTRRQGETARSTYWCPTCQPATADGDGRRSGAG